MRHDPILNASVVVNLSGYRTTEGFVIEFQKISTERQRLVRRVKGIARFLPLGESRQLRQRLES